MFIYELLDNVNKEKRIRERMNAAHYMATGLCVIFIAGVCVATGIFYNTKAGKELQNKFKNRATNTVDDLKNIVIKSADAVEVSVAHTVDKVCSTIETAHDKSDAIRKGFSDGKDRITKDVHDTADNITNEFKENN